MLVCKCLVRKCNLESTENSKLAHCRVHSVEKNMFKKRHLCLVGLTNAMHKTTVCVLAKLCLR